MAKTEPTEKQFSLKPIEVQMLQTKQDLYFTDLSNFLSFIAMERLAYQVTKDTKFKVDGDKLIITEEQPVPETTSPGVDIGAVSTGDDTANALGGKK